MTIRYLKRLSYIEKLISTTNMNIFIAIVILRVVQFKRFTQSTVKTPSHTRDQLSLCGTLIFRTMAFCSSRLKNLNPNKSSNVRSDQSKPSSFNRNWFITTGPRKLYLTSFFVQVLQKTIKEKYLCQPRPCQRCSKRRIH